MIPNIVEIDKINQTEIISKQKAPLAILNELEQVSLMPEGQKALIQNFLEIINFNKEYINEDLNSEIIKDIHKSYFIKKNISLDNKSKINSYLKQYHHKDIFNIYIDRLNQIVIENKIKLIDLYNIFFEKYIHEIIKKSEKITSVKIYDFYQDDENIKETIKKIEEKNKRNDFIKSIINQQGDLSKCNIQILTHLKTEESFEFYQKIYNEDNNITIKYIPESASKNIYIPSLFFMIIKYRVKETNRYKEIFLYLEPNTNWALIDSLYTTKTNGFLSRFVSLLNKRFDEQFNKNNLIFQVSKKEQTDNNFKKDIKNIFETLDYELNSNNDSTVLNKDILKNIHLLKTKYKTIKNAYSLIKSYYYISSYLNIISNIVKNKMLPHTNIVIQHIDTRLNTQLKQKINDFKINSFYHEIQKENIDIKKLRLGIIQEINNTQAICDIFPELNWLDQDNIIFNLSGIANDKNLLYEFYDKIIPNNNFTYKEKQNIFISKIVPKIINGESFNF